MRVKTSKQNQQLPNHKAQHYDLLYTKYLQGGNPGEGSPNYNSLLLLRITTTTTILYFCSQGVKLCTSYFIVRLTSEIVR